MQAADTIVGVVVAGFSACCVCLYACLFVLRLFVFLYLVFLLRLFVCVISPCFL